MVDKMVNQIRAEHIFCVSFLTFTSLAIINLNLLRLSLASTLVCALYFCIPAYFFILYLLNLLKILASKKRAIDSYLRRWADYFSVHAEEHGY